MVRRILVKLALRIWRSRKAWRGFPLQFSCHLSDYDVQREFQAFLRKLMSGLYRIITCVKMRRECFTSNKLWLCFRCIFNGCFLFRFQNSGHTALSFPLPLLQKQRARSFWQEDLQNSFNNVCRNSCNTLTKLSNPVKILLSIYYDKIRGSTPYSQSIIEDHMDALHKSYDDVQSFM